MIPKIATALADHGMEAATRTGYISTHRSQKEDRVHERKTESIRGDAFVVCSASSIQSPVMLAGEGVTSASPADLRRGGLALELDVAFLGDRRLFDRHHLPFHLSEF